MSSTDTSCSANPDPGLYKLKSKATGNVIFLDGKVQSNLISRGDSNDESKIWQLAHLGKGEYLILSSVGTAIRANVPGEALTSWYTPPAQPHSRWVFETVGAAVNGEYLIHSVTDNGQVIDLAKSGKADGTKILSWGQKKPTAKNQVWKLVPV